MSEGFSYCLADPGATYLLLSRDVSKVAKIDLGKPAGEFEVHWSDTHKGGPLLQGTVKRINGPGLQAIGSPPAEADKDWVVLVRR